MKNLNSKILKTFLKKASEKLKGRWVIVGGTLLPALGVDVRSTVDIDIVSLDTAGNSERMQLMEIAESLGLPVESINMAAEYFFHKIYKNESDLLPLIESNDTVLYRPTATLYILLKIQRMSESDLLDSLEMIRFAKKNQESLDIERIAATISAAIRTTDNEEKKSRLKILFSIIHKKIN